jgi:hypothetical protein
MKVSILYYFVLVIGIISCKNQEHEFYSNENKTILKNVYDDFNSYKFEKVYFDLLKIQKLQDKEKYTFACCCSMLNKYNEATSALLSIQGDETFDTYLFLESDIFLDSLHSDLKWKSVVDKFSSLKKQYDKKYFHPSIKILDKTYIDDQAIRQKFAFLSHKLGHKSQKVKEIGQLMYMQDLKNLSNIESIIKQYEWLGEKDVGRYRNLIFFLVLQHSNLETQKRYLPLFKEAVANSKASPKQLAYLIDRIEVSENRKQVYGTQIGFDEKTQKHFLLPLVSPDSVEFRRNKMGLDSLTNYLKTWGL